MRERQSSARGRALPTRRIGFVYRRRTVVWSGRRCARPMPPPRNRYGVARMRRGLGAFVPEFCSGISGASCGERRCLPDHGSAVADCLLPERVPPGPIARQMTAAADPEIPPPLTITRGDSTSRDPVRWRIRLTGLVCLGRPPSVQLPLLSPQAWPSRPCSPTFPHLALPPQPSSARMPLPPHGNAQRIDASPRIAETIHRSSQAST